VVGQALSVVAGLLVVAGAALVAVGVLGWRRRLPRNPFAGVRTVSTLRDDETFAVGNHVSALPTIGAGAVAMLGGLAAFAAPAPGGGLGPRLTLVVLATVGMLVLTVIGGVLGDRAARRVPMRAFGGCAGSCGGCACATSSEGSTAYPTEAEGSGDPAHPATQGEPASSG
jgi:SdpI/YfhL protein family